LRHYTLKSNTLRKIEQCATQSEALSGMSWTENFPV
jgi:hypothetical protein